jgi:hypothetical protein
VLAVKPPSADSHPTDGYLFIEVEFNGELKELEYQEKIKDGKVVYLQSTLANRTVQLAPSFSLASGYFLFMGFMMPTSM